jgi:DNA-binding NarL/FixJ family response regulator
MTGIRIVVADDHVLIRAGITHLLRSLDGVEVVGEAGDGLETLAVVERTKPDIVLLDIGMPGLNGLDVAARLATLDAPVATIILSMHESEEYVVRALQAGCSGYLLKGAAVSELEVAVRAVARGESYLSPAVSKRVVADYVNRTGGGDGSPLESLTPRQREILRLVAEGHTSRDIAEALKLSVKTVETHRAHIMERLGVREVTGLVRFAVKVGLVEP